MPLSRREVMKGAALLGSLASFSGAVGGVERAEAQAPLGESATPKTITSANYFDLSAASSASFQTASYVRSLRSAQSHYQVQGMAIDSATGSFFVAQTPDPDTLRLTMRVGGRAWSADAYDQHSSGDLVFSRFGLGTGAMTGSTYLMGAGHGGQIAVEPGSPLTYLWSEIYPGNPRAGNGKVYGTRLGRFPYLAGGLVPNTANVHANHAPAPYTVARWLPVKASHEYGATIDTSVAAGATSGVLVVRYRLTDDQAGFPRTFTAFDLAAARKGDFSAPLATTTEPTEVSGGVAHTEGFAVCGQYIYLVGTDNAGASNLYQIDVNATPGSYVAKVPLPGSGEPESVAIFAPNGVPTRLYYLTASVTTPRTFDLFWLDT